MVSCRDRLNIYVSVRTPFCSYEIILTLSYFVVGLQTQSNSNHVYRGPWDAMKKIYSSHGIAGIYKGQNVTLLREASGYGIYFWAYEKLVQREIAQKGIRRDEISPAKAVLYGAAAGYAVRVPFDPGALCAILTPA